MKSLLWRSPFSRDRDRVAGALPRLPDRGAFGRRARVVTVEQGGCGR